MRRPSFSAAALLATALLAFGCGGEKPASGTPPAPPAPGSDLTSFQLEHGIGPVTSVVELGPLDQVLADQGKAAFEVKCTACHKMGEKYVGPALGEVTTRRSPTFIMNMIMNPNEMVERHPVGKQLLAEHMTMMANQGIAVEEARAIVEYLRTQATGTVILK
ncbi:MAG: c-type cytochrome [Gemmatimonadales bacterium]